MTKIPRDVSFVRDGKPLEFWLRQLVSEDTGEHIAAASTIQSMRHAMPSAH